MLSKQTLTVFLAVFVCFNKAPTSAQAQKLSQLNQQEEVFFWSITNPKPGVGWEVTTTSGEAEIALAQHLANIGAKLYVTWWCPYSHEQKLLFGQQAYKIISTDIAVECDAKGVNAQPQKCKAASITEYPTWIIDGQQFSGVQNLEKLAEISGYKGNTNFKYIELPRFF